VEKMIQQVSRSSMVSMFGKAKFRYWANSLPGADVDRLSEAFHAQLYGDQQLGSEQVLDLLRQQKLAKWSLLTILPNYVYPDDQVFVKPTTAKGVIAHFELPELVYKPQPSWSFYAAYRAHILAMKEHVDPTLRGSNAAFCGFLMMSMM